jgi:hypothetical protein
VKRTTKLNVRDAEWIEKFDKHFTRLIEHAKALVSLHTIADRSTLPDCSVCWPSDHPKKSGAKMHFSNEMRAQLEERRRQFFGKDFESAHEAPAVVPQSEVPPSHRLMCVEWSEEKGRRARHLKTSEANNFFGGSDVAAPRPSLYDSYFYI